jgi:lysophospholipase L1-like esterase
MDWRSTTERPVTPELGPRTVVAVSLIVAAIASALTAPGPAAHRFAADGSVAVVAVGPQRTAATAIGSGLAVGSAAADALAELGRGTIRADSQTISRIPETELRPESIRVTPGAARAPNQAKASVPTLRALARMPAGSTAVFLGDSFTSGWNGAGLGRHGWPSIVAASRGWRAIDLAVPGTGFLNPGWTNQPVISRVAATIRLRPDIVVIASGHNDSRWSASATADAADAVIRRLRRALPDAVFVIVAPIWQNGSPPQRCLLLRDRLRTRAASIGAIFIDPLADGWFAGSRRQLIGPDRLHPTDAGHRFMAGRVLAALARLD